MNQRPFGRRAVKTIVALVTALLVVPS